MFSIFVELIKSMAFTRFMSFSLISVEYFANFTKSAVVKSLLLVKWSLEFGTMTFIIATTPANSVAVLGKNHGQKMESDIHKDLTFIITALDEIIYASSIGMVTFPKMHEFKEILGVS